MKNWTLGETRSNFLKKWKLREYLETREKIIQNGGKLIKPLENRGKITLKNLTLGEYLFLKKFETKGKVISKFKT